MSSRTSATASSEGKWEAPAVQEPHGIMDVIRQNSWFRLFVYCFACLTTSCIYFGWQAYASLIIRAGGYEWQCGQGSAPTIDPDDPAICLEQSKSVARLYAIANGTEFVFAAVAGVMLDTFGPRITALTGELSQLCSILLLVYSTQKFRAYPVAMILTGASVNIISFPALTVMEQWPTRQAFAVSVIVGSQSAASIVAPIIKAVSDAHSHWSVRQIWFMWLLVIWLPVTLLYTWTLPKSRDYEALLATAIVVPELSEERVIDFEGHKASVADLRSPEDELSEKRAGRGQWLAFARSLQTLDVWLMALFCACLMFQFAYYPAVVKDAVSMSISDLVSWLTPLQGIFSFFIGFIMDYSGTAMIMAAMGLTLIFVNLACAFGADQVGLQRLVAVWFIFVQSATYNVKYTFVNEMYDPFNFGKLVGVLGIAGGIGVYCTSPLVDRTDFRSIFKWLSGVAIIMLVITAVIFTRQQKGVTHKTVRAVEQKHRAVNNV